MADSPKLPTIVHVLFSGLGGHGSVVFSLIKASRGIVRHDLVFVGTSDLLHEYRERCQREGIRFSHEITSGGADVGFQWRVFRRIMNSRPDSVVVHSTGSVVAALAAKLLRPRTRVVVVEHQSWGLRGKWHAVATALSLLAADQILVLNEDYVHRVRARFPRLSRRVPIDIVRNGIDTDTFSPAVLPATGPSEPLWIGMQSRIIPIKDHATLIRSVHRLRFTNGLDVQLLLAGDGASRPDLESLVRDLDMGEWVRFLGMLDELDLVRFLQHLDVYVHASLGEAMSTALLQAMACGLPVVASEVPGITDLVAGHDVAVLVHPRDPDALAGAIGSLIGDTARCQRLGAAARSYVTTGYGLEQMWASYGPYLLGSRQDVEPASDGGHSDGRLRSPP